MHYYLCTTKKESAVNLNYDMVLMYHLDFQFLKRSLLDLFRYKFFFKKKINQNPSKKQRAAPQGWGTEEGLRKRLFTKGVGGVEGNQPEGERCLGLAAVGSRYHPQATRGEGRSWGEPRL